MTADSTASALGAAIARRLCTRRQLATDVLMPALPSLSSSGNQGDNTSVDAAEDKRDILLDGKPSSVRGIVCIPNAIL